MKIRKLMEVKLHEAEEPIDPMDKEEIADEVQDQTDMSEREADKLADKIQADAEDVGATSIAIVIDPDKDYADVEIRNDITDALDNAFEDAMYFDDAGEDTTANVLIEGLPGSGKTAIVKSWCQHHGLELLAFNATDPKLEASLNGIPLRDLSFDDKEDGADAAITYAYNIKKVEKLLNSKHPELEGKCVLFVDELNRQKAQQLRRPFMSLFNEKTNADGTLDFSKNLLFSVICINPYGDQYHDPGVGELVPAELNRFLSKITFDSTKDSSVAYFNGWINNKLLDLGIIPPNSVASKNHNGFVGPTKSLSAKDLELAKTFIKRYELATTILSHPSFRFDERGDAQEIWFEKADYLTSRLFTNGIAASRGDAGKFLNWVDYRSGLSKRAKDMFHEILDTYIMDENELWQDYGLVEKPKPNAVDDNAAKADTAQPSAAANIEDDNDDFEDDDIAAAGNKVGGSTSSTAQDIKDVMAGWSF